MTTAEKIIAATRTFNQRIRENGFMAELEKDINEELTELTGLTGKFRVANPLDYALAGFEAYVNKYVRHERNDKKFTLFVGMNPSAVGMPHTGIPFCDADRAAEWLGKSQWQKIHNKIVKNSQYTEILKSVGTTEEESGSRIALLMKDYGGVACFFSSNFLINYCPLAFLKILKKQSKSKTVSNISLYTVEKKLGLRNKLLQKLYKYCDEYLEQIYDALKPNKIVAFGKIAARQAEQVLTQKVVRVVHPSRLAPIDNEEDWKALTLYKLIVENTVWNLSDIECVQKEKLISCVKKYAKL